ncbi:MAG TPA: hypothetical protein VMS40_15045 [Vicinamibacterales bacterium]|nr:hypothetical protein [Vicinamibacterales bacterium]
MSLLRAPSRRLAAVLTLLVLSSLTAAPASAQRCDRACLGGMITQYVDALVARDSSKLPLADGVRFTEDSSELELGEGIWKSITGKGDFRQDYLDTTKQIAASHVVLIEDTNRILYSVLLYVQDRKITGIETLVQRITPTSRFQPTELGKPIRGFADPVPAGKRQARQSLIETALAYPAGLRIGSFRDKTPFATETYRVENGVITAGEGCGRGDCGMYTQRVILHPGIVASVAAVDEENGVVVLWMNFGFTDSYGPGNALVTFEAFKVWGYEIHSINAFSRTMPLATPRFWPSSDPIP